jgi:hypothetical protein
MDTVQQDIKSGFRTMSKSLAPEERPETRPPSIVETSEHAHEDLFREAWERLRRETESLGLVDNFEKALKSEMAEVRVEVGLDPVVLVLRFASGSISKVGKHSSKSDFLLARALLALWQALSALVRFIFGSASRRRVRTRDYKSRDCLALGRSSNQRKNAHDGGSL